MRPPERSQPRAMFGVGDIVARAGHGRLAMVVAIDGPVITVAWRLASGEIREGLASASALVLIRRPKDASRGAPRAK